MIKHNLKIIFAALAISLWYSASSRLFDLLIPKNTLFSTIAMFVLATLVLLYDNCCIAELLFDFKKSRFFSEKEFQ